MPLNPSLENDLNHIALQGHAIGFVDSPSVCDSVVHELKSAGVENPVINVLSGDEGAERLKLMVDGQMWGEASDELLKQGTIELSRGHCVLMVESRDRDQAMIVATISAKHGGRGFNYFGELIDEKLTR